MKKNKRIYYSFFGFFLLGLFAFIWPAASSNNLEQFENNSPSEEICHMDNETFVVGEKINYTVYYNLKFIWIPAAKVTFEVYDLGDQYHLKAEGKTFKTYDWIFKVRDYYEVFVDKETLLPTHSIRQVQEGGYSLYDEIHYDRERNMASSLRGKTKEIATIHEYPISSCTHDILSIIYYARNLNFGTYESGEKFPVNIFMDKEEWGLNVLYGGKEKEKKIKGLGKYNTYVFHPELISGEVFEANTVMNVFVSEDNNRVPMLIETPISVGSIKVVLKSCEGLRHEQSAKCP